MYLKYLGTYGKLNSKLPSMGVGMPIGPPVLACTYVHMARVCLACNTSYIYTRNYQSTVSIAGAFAAFSLMVVAKVRKLIFQHCCELSELHTV